VADWLNKKARAVERLGPPFLRPRSGPPLNAPGGLGSVVSSPSGIWGKAPADNGFLRISNCIPAFLQVTYFETFWGCADYDDTEFQQDTPMFRKSFLGRLAHTE
jgi:hypothetical protein